MGEWTGHCYRDVIARRGSKMGTSFWAGRSVEILETRDLFTVEMRTFYMRLFVVQWTVKTVLKEPRDESCVRLFYGAVEVGFVSVGNKL